MPKSVVEASRIPLGLTGAEGGTPPSKSKFLTSFHMEHQLQTQWCWAAVTASVAKYYSLSTWTQCRVVNTVLVLNVCCANATMCNKPSRLDLALGAVKALAPNGYVATNLLWSVLVAELEANRPVGVRINWSDNSGHFLVIDGYTDTGMVEVEDPWYGHSSVPFTQFLTAYLGTGRWSHSYKTVRPGPGALPAGAPNGNSNC